MSQLDNPTAIQCGTAYFYQNPHHSARYVITIDPETGAVHATTDNTHHQLQLGALEPTPADLTYAAARTHQSGIPFPPLQAAADRVFRISAGSHHEWPLAWFRTRLSLQRFLPQAIYYHQRVDNPQCPRCDKPITGPEGGSWDYTPEATRHQDGPIPDYRLMRACTEAMATFFGHPVRDNPYPAEHDPSLVTHLPAPSALRLITLPPSEIDAFRIIKLEELLEPLSAMGAAAWYAGSATLDYGLIITSHYNQTFDDNIRRYISGEYRARLSQECLEYINLELSQRSELPPEFRKYARQIKVWFATQRQRAAQVLDITPPPPDNDTTDAKSRRDGGEFAQLDYLLNQGSLTPDEYIAILKPAQPEP